MNHSDVRDEQQHALILQLTAENEMRAADYLKLCKEFDQLTAERDALQVRLHGQIEDNIVVIAECKTLKAELGAAEALEERLQGQLTELREALKEIDAKQRAAHDWNTPLNGRCPECGYNTELLETILAKLKP